MVKGSVKMVSNKKYKEALERCDRYRRMLDAKQGKDWFVLQDAIRYKAENEKLSAQVAEFKQKYLDELQKRIELAEFVKRLEGESEERPKTEEKPVTCRECKYLVYEPSYVHCTKGHNKSMSSLEYSCGEGEKRL